MNAIYTLNYSDSAGEYTVFCNEIDIGSFERNKEGHYNVLDCRENYHIADSVNEAFAIVVKEFED